MKHQIAFRSYRAMSIALVIIFAIVACQPNAPTQPSASSPAPEASSTAEAPSPEPTGGEATPTSQPAPDSVLYQDTFTNPATKWDDAKLGNYFVGYHAPEWYHIEISGADRVAISEPSRTSYEDVTLELQVFTVAAKTDPAGDFRYGLVFRRSGNSYYAFTISPNTKKWEMLKVSASEVVSLKEGSDDSIHDRDESDLLRVDATGSSFSLHINDHVVGQVTDDAYASGEVGIYGESIDSPKVHIHFDTFTIEPLTLDLSCNINDGTFNVRSGPSKTFGQLAVLSAGDTLQPLGASSNRDWIQIKLEGSDEPGWVSFDEGLMSCTPSIDLFPIVSP